MKISIDLENKEISEEMKKDLKEYYNLNIYFDGNLLIIEKLDYNI